MKPYKRHVMQDHLKILEPLAETAGYSINDGDPQAFMRLDRGSAGTCHRLGIWRCTSGTFTCTEKGDELQTLLAGRLTLVREDGSSHDFVPGDSFYTEKGERLTWKVTETVTKVFFTHDRDGVD